MDKRYQIFVSSLYTDLIEERQGVQKAILELDHMPAGMELFPASDASAWELICSVIDASDYYVLILSGRYGSLDENGLGYTEKEYEYAHANGMPVIPFLHKDPTAIIRDKTETDEALWEKLMVFRKKLEDAHTCKYWSTAEGLKAEVIVSLTREIRAKPRLGWVRADQLASNKAMQDIVRLQRRIDELEQELQDTGLRAIKDTENLAQGEDILEVEYTFYTPDSSPNEPLFRKIEISWNDLLRIIGMRLFTDRQFDSDLRNFISSRLSRLAPIDAYEEIYELRIIKPEIDLLLIQFKALGIIDVDEGIWEMTEYGKKAFNQLLAIRRKP